MVESRDGAHHEREARLERVTAARPPETPGPTLPPTVRLGSRGREPLLLVIVIAAFLGAALWKPWASPAGPRPLVQAPPTPVPSERPARASDGALATLREDCDEPAGWRVYSHEAFVGQIVRVWRHVEPIDAATGPLDRELPIVPAGPANRGLGYCAPWSGPESPRGDGVVSAWQIVRRAGQPDTARLLPLVPVAASPNDVRGALYAGPGAKSGGAAGRLPSWPAGRYVFAFRAAGWERWWAVEVLPDRPTRP